MLAVRRENFGAGIGDVQPLRDKLTELQLKEQAARLAAEQFASQLADAGADEVVTRLPDAVERARLVTPPAVRAAA